MHNSLVPGDEVITMGGIIGKVVEKDGDCLIVLDYQHDSLLSQLAYQATLRTHQCTSLVLRFAYHSYSGLYH